MGFWHVYMGIYGGGGEASAAQDIVTTRLNLYGTSKVRFSVVGSSLERVNLTGSSR